MAPGKRSRSRVDTESCRRALRPGTDSMPHGFSTIASHASSNTTAGKFGAANKLPNTGAGSAGSPSSRCDRIGAHFPRHAGYNDPARRSPDRGIAPHQTSASANGRNAWRYACASSLGAAQSPAPPGGRPGQNSSASVRNAPVALAKRYVACSCRSQTFARSRQPISIDESSTAVTPSLTRAWRLLASSCSSFAAAILSASCVAMSKAGGTHPGTVHDPPSIPEKARRYPTWPSASSTTSTPNILPPSGPSRFQSGGACARSASSISAAARRASGCRAPRSNGLGKRAGSSARSGGVMKSITPRSRPAAGTWRNTPVVTSNRRMLRARSCRPSPYRARLPPS